MPASGHELKLTAERFDASARTDVLTSQGTTTTGSTRTTVSDVEGFDEQDRTRVSLDYEWVTAAGALDQLAARAFYQTDESRQSTSENRLSVSPSRTTEVQRDGALTFEQRSIGGELRLSKIVRTGQVKHDLTLGGSLTVDTFDQLRLRTDTSVATGAPVPSFPLAFPSKYFPRSAVTNVGAFLQDSIAFQGDRIRVTPGVRFDRFRLDADQNDPVYLSGNAGIDPPVDMDDTAISPRIGAVVRVTSPLSAYGQYARGFRAPPFSFVNNGFTNVASGYTTLVARLRWHPSLPFGGELIGTFVDARDDVDTSVTDQVRTPGYGFLDVTIFYGISTRFSLQAAVINIFDRTYLAWSDVQGITSSSPVLDRYTSPGRSVSAAIRFRT